MYCLILAIQYYKFFLLIAIVLILSSSCKNVEDRWKDAESANSIEAYEEFLKRYPRGGFANEASSRLEILYFNRAKTEDTVKSYEEFLKRYPQSQFVDEIRLELKKFPIIRVEVDQYYGEAINATLQFYEEVKDMLEQARFKVVGEGSNNFEASVNIKVRGKPQSIWCQIISVSQGISSVRDNIQYYSGAIIDGTISLNIPVNLPSRVILPSTGKIRKFHGERVGQDCPNTIQYLKSQQTPDTAPFKEALCNSEFYEVFYAMVAEKWTAERGVRSLLGAHICGNTEIKRVLLEIGRADINSFIAALKSKRIKNRDLGIGLLGVINDVRASEFLVSSLNDEDGTIRILAASTLLRADYEASYMNAYAWIKDESLVQLIKEAFEKETNSSVKYHSSYIGLQRKIEKGK